MTYDIVGRTVFGFDYFRVVYGAAGCLLAVLVGMYFLIEDDSLRKAIMTQGLFSCGLIITIAWFHANRDKKVATRKKNLAESKKASAEAKAYMNSKRKTK